MNTLRYTLLIVMFALASCEKNVEVKVPKHEPKLALYSVNTPDEIFTATVSKSIGILEYNPNVDLQVTDAFVRLLDDGLVVDTLTYDATEQRYKSDVLAEMGHSYTLQANTNETAAYATAGFTNNVGVNNIERIQNAKVDNNGNPMDELIVSFSDPAVSTDYYRVTLFYDNSVYFYWCIQSNDPSIENPSDDLAGESCLSQSGIYLSDALFNGTEKQLHLFVDHFALETFVDEFGNVVTPKLRFEYLTEDYFRYLKTYDFAQWNDGNPFAEPSNVYSNVHNGFGVFAIVGKSEYEIQ